MTRPAPSVEFRGTGNDQVLTPTGHQTGTGVGTEIRVRPKPKKKRRPIDF